ncbi:MAG: FAD-binding oxidoreductase [Elusimicrobia bacterium]|nr:FAD-binding oxidoreductase [Elusimicrobiota bacterium]
MYKKIETEIIEKLKNIVGTGNIILEKEKMEDYSHDEYAVPEIKKYPEVVVKPKTTEEVSAVLKLANENNFPVTARGGATGLCGACVPFYGGVVLSLENMNKVVEVDTNNLMVVVEAGTTLKDMYKEINKANLFFPPHPGDESATIGGVIATNAGGSRAIKYGVTRNFVRGLEVVFADGSIAKLGGKLMKNSTGYSLQNLLIGSEGTLGVVTKATINLLPLPKYLLTLIIPYEDLHSAIQTVPLLFQNKIMPLAIEFIEKDIIPISENYLDKKWPVSQGKADLMIIIESTSDTELMKIAEQISEVCLANSAIDVFIAESAEKQETILAIRGIFYEALKSHTIEMLDITVPISEIANFVDEVNKISKKYNMWFPIYGHAGDGNVHIHIMNANLKGVDTWEPLDAEYFKKNFNAVKEEIYSAGHKLAGIVSGEHGIGLVKKDLLYKYSNPKEIELMKSIKKAFDPNSILNPGKIF